MKYLFYLSLLNLLILSQSMMGASLYDYQHLTERLGFLYNINSRNIQGCNAYLVDEMHIRTMKHCYSFKRNSGEVVKLELDDYVFIADGSNSYDGEWDSRTDYEGLGSGDFRAAALDSRTRAKVQGHFVIIKLASPISINENFRRVDKPRRNKVLLAYAIKTRTTDDGIRRSRLELGAYDIGFTGKQLRGGEKEYRLLDYPSLNTESVSGALIVNENSRVIGQHEGELRSDMRSKLYFPLVKKGVFDHLDP